MTTTAISVPTQGHTPPTLAQDWVDEAMCSQVDPEAFFPDTAGRTASQARQYDTARSICHQCPVMQQCREQVMEFERGTSVYQRFGMFGGLTPAERSDLDSSRSSEQETVAGHSHRATQPSNYRVKTLRDAGHS